MSSLSGALAQKRILLGVTGSIAAYKAPLVLRQLQAQGAKVHVILTRSAARFIGRATFSGLGVEVSTQMWEGPGEPHVALAKWADCLVIAPATAHVLAKLSAGACDDLLSATALCFSGPTFVAPAMHPNMWASAATQENVARLKERQVGFWGPEFGSVASGDEGMGRLLAPEALVESLVSTLTSRPSALAGKHVVVTAGPTREAIDPVRAITNISTGKMGYALARAAVERGARVTLITGPVHLEPPRGTRVVPVESALQMSAALDQALGADLKGADALVMAAAVSDYRPAHPQSEKLKRSGHELQIALLPNPDLLFELGQRRTDERPILVGFALETLTGGELTTQARLKLAKKRVDLIVANSAADSLGRDENTVQLVSASDCVALPRMAKTQVAEKILDFIEERLERPLGQKS